MDMKKFVEITDEINEIIIKHFGNKIGHQDVMFVHCIFTQQFIKSIMLYAKFIQKKQRKKFIKASYEKLKELTFEALKSYEEAEEIAEEVTKNAIH